MFLQWLCENNYYKDIFSNYIKSYIASKIGTKVVVICYYSRNKKERFNGVILNVYPKVFTVRLHDGMIKSFNYVDIIAKNIKIFI